MPCRKLLSICHCGGQLWIVVEKRVGVVVCPDCGYRKLACDESTHPLLEESDQERLDRLFSAEIPDAFNQN
jgi:hypothetical protein